MSWFSLALTILLLAAQPVNAADATPEQAVPTSCVGIESTLNIALPVSGLHSRQVRPNDPLLLRVKASAPTGSGTRYHLLYTGFVPGLHNLADYLVQHDGTKANELPDIPVRIHSVLPEGYDGHLASLFGFRFPWRPGYRWYMRALWVLWGVVLLPLLWLQRPPRPAPPPPPEPPPPTLIERLRPLVAAAALGELDLNGKRTLDMLLLRHFRDALDLDETDMAAATARMRAHPHTGPLLRQVERWLHSPEGGRPRDVEQLLQPFAGMPVMPTSNATTPVSTTKPQHPTEET